MSIAGVAIGSAGLLIALSIVHGFRSTINTKILGFAPHALVTSYSDSPLFRADTVLTFLDQYEEIESKQIIDQGQVMIQTKNGVTGTELKGVDPNEDVSNLTNYLLSGEYDLSITKDGFPGIILGSKMAQTLQADVGSIITVYTISGEPTLVNSPEIQQFQLTGIFRTGIDFFDEIFAVVDRDYTKQLFGLRPTQGHGIEIKLIDPELSSSFKEKLEEELPFPYQWQSIEDRYYNIFEWVKLQEQMIPPVISVMIIVAAFNLIGAVLMMVLERTRDIGVLKTIGSRSSVIRKVFLLEGLMVAGIGLLIGIAISLLFAWLQINYQIIPLSEENYYMSYAPVEPHALDFVITTVVTLVLCALASWLPARIAAKTDPLKVIAYGR